MNKRNLIIVGLIALLFIIIGFSLGKCSNKNKIITIIPNDYIEKRKYDSLQYLFIKSQDANRILYNNIDTLKLLRIKNHQTITNEIKKIKNFTYNSRKHYLDSIYSAESK